MFKQIWGTLVALAGATLIITVVILGVFGCSNEYIIVDDTDAADAADEVNLSCGNGILDPEEQCDDGNTIQLDGCHNSCLIPRCGDGITDVGEECDDGNASNTDACLVGCFSATCGDMHVQEGVEDCDDGDTIDTDDCLNTCVEASCGDGYIWAGHETCDNGAANSNTVADACRTTCVPASCGDGMTDTGEECDAGAVPVAGCTPAGGMFSCTIEPGWYCEGQPSVCISRCGDGIVATTGEQCDDGNNTAGDGCSSTCRTEAGWCCLNHSGDVPESTCTRT